MDSIADPTEALATELRRIRDSLPGAGSGEAVAASLREACLSPTPKCAGASGQVLLRAGLLTQADSLYRTLAQLFPTLPTGLVGLAHVAMRRNLWVQALARWDEVISAFPEQNNAYWRAARARVLGELGRHEAAAAALEEVVRDFGNQPFGYNGLANLAMQRQRWAEAVERWDGSLARFPAHDSVPFTRISRAGALAKLRRWREAEAELREVLGADPANTGALAALSFALSETGRNEQALELLASPAAESVASPALCNQRLWLLVRLRRLADARAAFASALGNANTLEWIEKLFSLAAVLHEGWPRTETWIALLQRLEGLAIPEDSEEAAPFHVLRARIKLALRDHAGFSAAVGRLKRPESMGELGRTLQRVAATLDDPRFPDFSKPKVFGIGFSKTATTTLARALSILGLSGAHWTNPLTLELIADADAPLFDALSDTPICASFEKYYYTFRNAKFIYTTRPTESWVASIRKHMKLTHNIRDFEELNKSIYRLDEFNYGNYFREIHISFYSDHANYDEVYYAYDRRVRRFFQDKPAEKFLEFNVFAGDGWPKLCTFLGHELPSVPFPCENRRLEDKRSEVWPRRVVPRLAIVSDPGRRKSSGGGGGEP